MLPTVPLNYLVPIIFLLASSAAAEDPFPCPSGRQIVYSPFQPWFHYQRSGDAQQCWHYATCAFTTPDESRKQQFAAVAFVMGFIPLTLKDLAWPKRRILRITKRLACPVEVIVRALGFEPVHDVLYTQPLIRNWGKMRLTVMSWLSGGVLCTTYALLVVMEVYSKRSALGCPIPVFITGWYILGIFPAIIHTLSVRGDSVQPSAVQGEGEWWYVQLVWVIYYITGALVYTSIMAVTVVELTVWVFLSFAVAGASKLLAFSLCLVWGC